MAGAVVLVVAKLWVRREPAAVRQVTSSGAALAGVPAALGALWVARRLRAPAGIAVPEGSYRSLATVGVVVLASGLLLVAPVPWSAALGWGRRARRWVAVVAVAALSVPATAVLARGFLAEEVLFPQQAQAVPDSTWPTAEAEKGGGWSMTFPERLGDVAGSGAGLLVREGSRLLFLDRSGTPVWCRVLPGRWPVCGTASEDTCPLVLDPGGERVLVAYQEEEREHFPAVTAVGGPGRGHWRPGVVTAG